MYISIICTYRKDYQASKEATNHVEKNHERETEGFYPCCWQSVYRREMWRAIKPTHSGRNKYPTTTQPSHSEYPAAAQPTHPGRKEYPAGTMSSVLNVQFQLLLTDTKSTSESDNHTK